MKRDLLIKLAGAAWHTLLWGGIVAVFAGIIFFRSMCGPVIIGGMMSVFISLLFAFWRMKLEAKQDQERYEKFTSLYEKIRDGYAALDEAVTEKGDHEHGQTQI